MSETAISKIKRGLCKLLYYGFAQYLPVSDLPLGKLSQRIRFVLCRQLFAKCGRNVNVERRVFFHSGRNVSIGDNSGIGKNSSIAGKVTIGNNVMMGPDVTIWTRNHNFCRTDIPMNQQGFKPEQPVMIGDDVWIGSHVIILPGVTIGSGSILGAGAVISKDIPEMAVVVGNPAQVVKIRTHQEAFSRKGGEL